MRRTAPPSLDPARLERIRSRVLVTVAASGLTAMGCDHTPEHTINRPAVVHPTAPEPVHHPTNPPRVSALGDGSARVGTVNTPFRPPPADAAVAPPVVRPPPENTPLPIPTANPPGPPRPITPRPTPVGNPPGPRPPPMPPGNG